MAVPRSCRWWTIATFFAGLSQATTAAGVDTGPVRLLNPAVAPQVVWSHAASACSNTDYSDVPVRPFYGHARGQPGRTLYWFASNSTGYLATIGVPPADGTDILAKMVRVIDTNGQCATWITSGPYTEAPITPANGVPQSYNTGQWMVAPFTPDGRRVFALVHNEFHGELTAPPHAPSIYCTITQATPLPGNACGYWNIVEAVSFNGGRTFAMETAQPPGSGNAPAIALPYPYLLPTENGGVNRPQAGMTAQSNIIQWGRYYYVLVQQLPSAAPAQQPPGQLIGADGVCIYRTADLADRTAWRGWDGSDYTVPVIGAYPANLVDPARYTCTPALSRIYRFSWSYNTVLRQFIVLGLDTNFGGNGTEAFVYTTGRFDERGQFYQTGGEHFLRAINWIDRWSASTTLEGEAYPSLLDPTSPDIEAEAIPNRTPGDLNFQYSGAHPYLYFTLLHPIGSPPNHTNRDVVRQPLIVTPQAASTP
jgi:hypothetical protein